MFNSDLKERLELLESKHRDAMEYLLGRMRELEQDFNLLLTALNMEIRKAEQYVLPRRIASRPAPVVCCTSAPEPPPPTPPTTKRRKKGKR